MNKIFLIFFLILFLSSCMTYEQIRANNPPQATIDGCMTECAYLHTDQARRNCIDNCIWRKGYRPGQGKTE
jgi:hypothetical protein